MVRRARQGPLPDRTEVVYVSPLKALSNDVHKNLEVPLAEIRALAAERSIALAPIRTALLTGDTPQGERQRMTRERPHILVTTPEPLYIQLEAEGQILRGHFTAGAELEWCNRRLLARIHRLTIGRLRPRNQTPRNFGRTPLADCLRTGNRWSPGRCAALRNASR